MWLFHLDKICDEMPFLKVSVYIGCHLDAFNAGQFGYDGMM
jgi:hypothetical protein